MTKPDEQQMREEAAENYADSIYSVESRATSYNCGLGWIAAKRGFQAGAAWQQSSQSAETDEELVERLALNDDFSCAVLDVAVAVRKEEVPYSVPTPGNLRIIAKAALSALGCLPSQVKELREEFKKWKAEAKHQTKASQAAARYLGKYLDEDTKSRTALAEENVRLKQERDAALGILSIEDLPPEGERTKLDEWQACYAALFRQIHPVMDENKRLKEQLNALPPQ